MSIALHHNHHTYRPHQILAGHQHIEKEATRMSSCDTACLFWQNNTATGDARTSLVPFPPSLEADIRATFRSAVSSLTPPPHALRA